MDTREQWLEWYDGSLDAEAFGLLAVKERLSDFDF